MIEKLQTVESDSAQAFALKMAGCGFRFPLDAWQIPAVLKPFQSFTFPIDTWIVEETGWKDGGYQSLHDRFRINMPKAAELSRLLKKCLVAGM